MARPIDPDRSREVVCPDTGERFDNVAEAAKDMRRRGFAADAAGVLNAIRFGSELCGRYFDWKWPEGHGKEPGCCGSSPPPRRLSA